MRAYSLDGADNIFLMPVAQQKNVCIFIHSNDSIEYLICTYPPNYLNQIKRLVLFSNKDNTIATISDVSPARHHERPTLTERYSIVNTP